MIKQTRDGRGQKLYGKCRMKQGGHFGVFEAPEDMAHELREFFRELRKGE